MIRKQKVSIMLSRMIVIGFAMAAVLSWTNCAHGLLRRGALGRGAVLIPATWPQEQSLKALLRANPCVGGHYFSAPTWENGIFSATYLFRGNEEQLQRMIDELDRLQSSTSISVHESEGFDDPSQAHGTKDTICYDWRLQFTTSRMKFAGKMINHERRPHMHLSIFLGTRLHRDKLRIPDEIRVEPIKLDRESLGLSAYPANALHAIARAVRAD